MRLPGGHLGNWPPLGCQEWGSSGSWQCNYCTSFGRDAFAPVWPMVPYSHPSSLPTDLKPPLSFLRICVCSLHSPPNSVPQPRESFLVLDTGLLLFYILPNPLSYAQSLAGF